jgi:hypothetical protein
MKMNDGEAKCSPAKSSKATSEVAENLDSKYLKPHSSNHNSKQLLNALDLQELKEALPSVPTGEEHNTSLAEPGVQQQLAQD